jgi:hypothetical protein
MKLGVGFSNDPYVQITKKASDKTGREDKQT